jgi:dihydroneopterin triphosphate diphosphatase
MCSALAEQPAIWKRPESVLIVVYTRAGAVLMMERTTPSGFWQSVTGSLQWDELPAAAAQRELHEETGLDIKPRDCQIQNRFPILPAWRARYAPEVQENIEHVFAVELATVCAIQLSGEHSQYEWLDVPTAIARCSSWTNAEAIRLLCAVV